MNLGIGMVKVRSTGPPATELRRPPYFPSPEEFAIGIVFLHQRQSAIDYPHMVAPVNIDARHSASGNVLGLLWELGINVIEGYQSPVLRLRCIACGLGPGTDISQAAGDKAEPSPRIFRASRRPVTN